MCANLLSWLGDRVHDAENGVGQALGGAGNAIGQGVQNVERSFAPPTPVQGPPPPMAGQAPSFGFGPSGMPPTALPPQFSQPDFSNTINSLAKIGPKYQQPIQKPDSQYGGSSEEPSNNPILRVANPVLQMLGQVPLAGTPVQVANQANDFANKYSQASDNPMQQFGQGLKDIAAAGIDNSPQVQALQLGGQAFGHIANQATQSLGLNSGNTDLPFFGQTTSEQNLIKDKGLLGALGTNAGEVLGASGAKVGTEGAVMSPTQILKATRDSADNVVANLPATKVYADGPKPPTPITDNINPAQEVIDTLAKEHAGQLGLQQEAKPPLLSDIKMNGGLKTDAGISAEMSSVPTHIRNNNGFTPDDMAKILASSGHQFEDGRALLSAIQDASQTKKLSNSQLLEQAHQNLSSGSSPEARAYQGAVNDLKTTPQPTTAKEILDHYRASPDATPQEKAALQNLLADPNEAMRRYNQRVLDEFGSTNIVAGDEAKYSMNGFNATMSGIFHEPASALAKVKYDQLLADPTTSNKPVMLMAGGSGSGKTTGVKLTGHDLNDYAAVIDTNSNKLGSASNKINQALATGRPVEINYVYRDPHDAFKNGVVPRAIDKGRIISVDTHIDTHFNSLKVVKELQAKYADNPNVNINIIDNSLGKGKQAFSTLAKLPESSYNESNIKPELERIVNEHPKITPEERQTYLASTAVRPENDAPRVQEVQPNVGQPDGNGTSQPQVAPIERGFSKTVRTSPTTSEPLAAVTNSTYDAPRNTSDLGKWADSIITKDPVAAETEARNAKTPDEATAIYSNLIHHYDQSNDISNANRIEQEASAHLTELGRGIQAATLYNKLAPDSIIRHTNNLLKAAGKGEIKPADAEALIARSKAVQELPAGIDKTTALAQLKKDVAQQIPSSIMEKGLGLWRTGLLTGPQTVSKVMVSHAVENTLESISRIPATVLDQTLGRGISKLLNGFGQRSQTLTAQGLGGGIARGTVAAKDVLLHGKETPMTSGMGSNIAEVSHGGVNYGNSVRGKIAQAYTEKVGNVHAAMPKIFYAAAHDNGVADYAKAQGINKGLSGDALKEYVASERANPSNETLSSAKHDAEMSTFQQKTKIGDAASGIQGKTGIVGKVAAPFTRIPSAIATDAINYSPLGGAKTIIEAIRDNGQEGWTPQVQRRFVQGLGRSITGSAIPAVGAALYASGNLALGYPTDQKTRDLWAAQGKQANSIKMGGRWRQLGSMGPAGTVLALGGYMTQAGETNAKGVSQLSAGIFGAVKSLADQTYLQGISSVAGAVNDPARSFNTYVKNQAASIIPTGVGTIARATDPLQRQTNTIGDAIAAKVPGLREGLTQKLDGFGNPLQRQGSVAENLVDPTRPSGPNPGTNPALLTELNRLATAGNTTFPDQSKDKTIGSGKDQITLTPDQVNARRGAVGPQLQDAWNKIIATPEYQALSDTNKSKALDKAMNDLNNVNTVQTLKTVDPTKVQKAYNGLDANQKAMFGGQPSVKDYTNLDANGKVLNTAKVDPKTAYQQKLDKFNQQKAGGLLSATDTFNQQQALNKEAITSNYSKDVQNLYGMNRNARTAAYSQNPQLAALAPQVSQLSSDLLNHQFTSTDVVAKQDAAAANGGGRGGGGHVRPPSAHKMTVARAGAAYTKLVTPKIHTASVKLTKSKPPKRLA